MKSTQVRRRILTAPLAVLTGALLLSKASATTLYWDGATSIRNADGGAGTWVNGTTTNWDTVAFGGTGSVWTNGAHTAVFGGAASPSVTIGTGGVTVGGLTFNTTGYTIGAGTNGLTFSSATNNINFLMSTHCNPSTL